MLDDILLFLKIVELGSFRKAAASLRLSLPTVSKRISALESRLDNKLMKRDAKSITLTDYGKLIYLKFQSLSMYYTQIENINNDYKIHLYGKTARPNRKLGHITALGPNRQTIEQKLSQLTRIFHHN
jgi:DNA-binding transcriptional LysR family regulator